MLQLLFRQFIFVYWCWPKFGWIYMYYRYFVFIKFLPLDIAATCDVNLRIVYDQPAVFLVEVVSNLSANELCWFAQGARRGRKYSEWYSLPPSWQGSSHQCLLASPGPINGRTTGTLELQQKPRRRRRRREDDDDDG